MKERFSFNMNPKFKPLHASLMRLGFSEYLASMSFKNLVFEFDLDSEWRDCKNECRNDPDKLSNAFFLLINIIHDERTDNEEVTLKILIDFLETRDEPVELKKVISCLKELYFEESIIKTLISKANKFNKKLGKHIPHPINNLTRRDLSKVFIIHGHDKVALLELEKLIKEEFSLIPVIIQQSPNDGLDTIISKFERLATECSFAIALFTPDDETSQRQFRARQNVILELGYFLGRDQGLNRKIVVLKKGNVEIPSDIHGVIYIPFVESVNEVHLKLRNQLKHWNIIK